MCDNQQTIHDPYFVIDTADRVSNMSRRPVTAAGRVPRFHRLWSRRPVATVGRVCTVNAFSDEDFGQIEMPQSFNKNVSI